ncbi:hypothetical protein B0H63DRAFT_474750 [Podospora didyma]|uniref:Nudix hydrolase domain-containing protein n=1 Tax=Podospora didyma TaxID=330526 RepID=A0AAE0TVB9_9PEZI|nr:hypothetical protein B0H63DRAFT_474750 [Podospora didyma]
MAGPPSLTFTFAESLSPLDISATEYLSAHPTISVLIVCAVVVVCSPEPRVLLIQRAPADGFPLQWECPGGGVDADVDPTVLQAVARELFEESGLVMTHAEALLDDTMEWDCREGRARKITCLVNVEGSAAGSGGAAAGGELPRVVLSPDEHCDHVWASKQDISEGRCDGRELKFAYGEQKQIILEALGRLGAA